MNSNTDVAHGCLNHVAATFVCNLNPAKLPLSGGIVERTTRTAMFSVRCSMFDTASSKAPVWRDSVVKTRNSEP